MSAGGGAMIQGGNLSSNKGLPAMEGAYTTRNDVMGYPRSFDEATQNLAQTIQMLETGDVTEDVVEALLWTLPVTFQHDYKNIDKDLSNN